MTTEEALTIIGRRIRLIREQLNISQEQLAELVGVSQTNLSRYEAGEVDIPLTRLVRLSKVLHVEVSVLAHEVSRPPEEEDTR